MPMESRWNLALLIAKWAGTGPVDPGTRRVISDGIRILYDPEGMLGSLLMVCLPEL
jgi:hypothetical protein